MIYILKCVKYFLLRLRYFIICWIHGKINLDRLLLDGDVLFITHSFGGGTALYESSYIQQCEENIVILRFISYGKEICYHVENTKTQESAYIGLKRYKDILQHSFKKVVVNSLVTSSNVEMYLKTLTQYKNENNCKLYYFVHDFHAVCPRINLITNDFYCSLNCKRNNCKFNVFDDNSVLDVNIWRKHWNLFLEYVDKIVCFSKSSKTILQYVYSSLSDEKIVIQPHNTSYIKNTNIDTKKYDKFTIGIIGACHTIPKGKLIIEKLLQELQEEITVNLIGTKKSEIKTKRKNVFFYGRYDRNLLQDILIEKKINLIIFPSVCPETFSFLISELIVTGIPIISFNFGAQGEKLNNYKNGIVCDSVEEMERIIEKMYGEFVNDR